MSLHISEVQSGRKSVPHVKAVRHIAYLIPFWNIILQIQYYAWRMWNMVMTPASSAHYHLRAVFRNRRGRCFLFRWLDL